VDKIWMGKAFFQRARFDSRSMIWSECHDQGCYSQWGIVFYRVPHNYFINVAVLLTEQDIARCVYVSDSQPGRNSSPGRNFINSGEELVTYSLYSKCCTSFLSLHWLFQFIIFIFVSYLVDYHTFLLTN